MRQITVTTDVFLYDELSDDAKRVARDWFTESYCHDTWWDSTYEDAERIGLKITSFDLGQAQDITGMLTASIYSVIRQIQSDHGKDCATYKLTEKYNYLLFKLGQEPTDSESYDIFHDKIDDLTSLFEKELLQEYFEMLQKEIDYMYTTEYIEEGIRANDYEFTSNGERF